VKFTSALSRLWNSLAISQAGALRKHLATLLSAYVDLGYHPKAWRVSTTVVHRKQNKKDHSGVKAYRPISLLNNIGKVLEKIFQMRLSYLTTHLLPPEQFGGRAGYSAPDAVLHLLHKVQTSKEVTSGIMIDVKGAFDHVRRDTLIGILEKMALLSALPRFASLGPSYDALVGAWFRENCIQSAHVTAVSWNPSLIFSRIALRESN
jgi:hypothetical protein